MNLQGSVVYQFVLKSRQGRYRKNEGVRSRGLERLLTVPLGTWKQEMLSKGGCGARQSFEVALENDEWPRNSFTSKVSLGLSNLHLGNTVPAFQIKSPPPSTVLQFPSLC